MLPRNKKPKKVLGNSETVLGDSAVDKSRKPKGKATAKATKVLNISADDVESRGPVEVDYKTLFTEVGPPGKADGSKRNAWAVTLLTDAKQPYLETFKGWWGAGALHHLISKEKLSSIGEELTRACERNSTTKQDKKKAQKAALNFWYLCCELAGERIYAAVQQGSETNRLNPVRLLWNMPIMVSLGPERTAANNPGQGFDADTEPAPGGAGKRRLTGASQHLLKLEATWDAADAADAGKGDYGAVMWRNMHKCLSEAHRASTGRGRGANLLYPPLPEQWLQDKVNPGYSRRSV